MTMFRMFGSLVLAGALVLAATPAHANHIPGATYTGTTNTGGAISFEVSEQGGAVTRFAWSGVPNPNPECPTLTSEFIGKAPIVNHAFSGYTYLRFRGSFPSNQQAAGRLTWHTNPGGPGGSECSNFSIGWTATTTAAAPPTPTSDVIPPDIGVHVRNRLSRGGKLTVWVTSPEEGCRVTVGGKLSIAGGAGTFHLGRVRARLPHGANLPSADFPIEPRLSGRALAVARRALRVGRRVKLNITVRAVDAAGNIRLQRSTVRLRR